MEEDKQESSSIVPVVNNQLTKISNTISVTNKILAENNRRNLSLESKEYWLQFRGNIENNGISTNTPPIFGRLKWKFKTEGYIWNSPALIKGVIFFCSEDSYFYSLDAFTGELNWKFKPICKPKTTPLINNNMIFFGCSDENIFNMNSFLYCLDFNGKEIWKFKTEKSVSSNPTVNNGTIYITDGGRLYAVDIFTGKEKWRIQINETFYRNIVIHEHNIFLSYSDYVNSKGGMMSVNSLNGNIIWKFSIDNNIQSSPSISNKEIFIGGEGIIYVLNALDGKEKLRIGEKDKNNYQNYKDYQFSISGKEIYCINRKDYVLSSISLDNKAVQWKFQTDGAMHSGPILIGETIYFGCGDSKFYAIDVNTGKEKWNFSAENAIMSSPAIANGLVYFGSNDGYLYAIE